MNTGETFEKDGFTFRVTFERDEFVGKPWKMFDTIGNVRVGNEHNPVRSDKRPGERPLNDPDRNQHQYYYDWQCAVKKARAEFKTSADAITAVEREFEHLSGWLNNEWEYIVVTVEMIDTDENVMLDTSLGGVESLDNYGDTVAVELACELISMYGDSVDGNQYTVVVGNIGTVLQTHLIDTAKSVFNDYVLQSKTGRGRAGGEPVTLMCGENVVSEHIPANVGE